MTDEFDLSEKIREWWDRNVLVPAQAFAELEEIKKEFIQRLKEEFIEYTEDNEFPLIGLGVIISKIDKLAGEMLK